MKNEIFENKVKVF